MFTLEWESFHYGRKQFALWRMAFGLYLAFYFYRILPYGTELFSEEGPFSNLSQLRHQTFFPDSLLVFDSPALVSTYIGLCIGLSLCIAVGLFRKSAAFCLWLLILWLYNRNPYSNSPEYGFTNWLIFALAFIPSGEDFSIGAKDPDWYMPKYFYWGAWIVLAVGYFYAGASKFRDHDPHWMNGTAMYYVLATNNARLAWYGDFFDFIPQVLFIPLTWGALLMQTLSPVFIVFRKVRPWWWLVATFVHVSLLFFENLAQLTWGMIFFHLFLFDQRWLEHTKEWIRSRQKR